MQTYWHTAYFLATGDTAPPMGSGNLTSAPYQAFATQDGWVNVGAANQANWERLVKVLNVPELAQDARFRTNSDRMAHRSELVEALTPLMKKRTTAEWIKELEAAGLPAGPILSIPEMLEHPQTLARGMVVETEHARVGTIKALGFPVRFSETPGAITRPAPVLGQHTREVLAEYGYSAERIEGFIKCGAVIAAE